MNPGGVFSAGNPAFILTATTSGTAHTLHTAVTGTASVDLVTLWVYNNTAVNDSITLLIGAVQIGPITVNRSSLPAMVLARVPISNGVILKAFALTTATVGVIISTTRLVDQAQ